MADEQIIVDIQVDSKEVGTAEKRIDDLTDSIEELGNRIGTARKQNKEFKKDQQDLNKLYKDGGISSNKYEKEVGKLNDKIKVNNKIIAKSSIELSKQKSERSANIKLINSEANSLEELQAKATLLNKAITKQSTATKEGREEYEKLSKELKVTNELVNEQRQAFNDNTRNIGNYKDSLKGAKDGTNTLSQSFKALLANPVIFVLAAIALVLKTLFSAFKRSEGGAKLLNKASAALEGVMLILVKVMNVLANALTKAFEDPKQAVIDLWEAIKTNLVNRIEGIVVLFKALANIDFKNLKKSAEDVGRALIQINTGLTEEDQKRIADGFEDMAIEAAILAKRMADLAGSQRAMRAQSRDLEKDIAVLNAEFERLGEIAGDDTRNMEDMRQAAIDAGKAGAELAAKQEKLAQIRLNTISQEVSIRRSAGEDIQDLLDQQAQAEVALTEARSQAAIAQQKILIEQRKIERDIFEQNLDILLDIGDRIKTEQERAILNENLSLEKRKKLLEASKVALTANFAEIKKEYELYGVTAEQINDVINASDAKQTNEKLKNLGLNEIAINRLREIILERRQAEIDFNDLSKDLSDEEIERKQSANEQIKELNEEITLSQIENAEELKDKLIEFEEARLQLLLEDEKLLAEEREAIILESEVRIQEIENEFADEKKEKDKQDLEDRKDFLQDFFSDIIGITGRFAGEELAIFGRISQGIVDAFEDGKISATEALEGIGLAASAVFLNISASRAEDLAENEAARKRQLEVFKDSQEAQDEINEFFDKKSAALKLKQFKADKAKALIDIAIATAVAVAKALPNIPLSVVVGAFGLAQGVIVATKKPPKFGGGTSDIVNIGGSHASGNDVDVFGVSGGQKQYFGKVEKGEAMPVIRKSAVNDYMISKLNGRFSGRGKTFQGGTPDITNQDQTQNNEVFVNQLVNAFENIQIVAKIEDITKEAGRKIEIVDNSKV